MDVLESEDGSNASVSDSVGSDNNVVARPATRVSLPRFPGMCVGDAIGWIGQGTTRVVALQSGGTSTNREHWGHLWAMGLKDLGGDVGAAEETRMCKDSEHAAACRGMKAAGYVDISHGASAAGPGLAAGVMIAVRDTLAGGWLQVDRDGDGRGIAANVGLHAPHSATYMRLTCQCRCQQLTCTLHANVDVSNLHAPHSSGHPEPVSG